MNQYQHKVKAERLIDAVQKQIDLVQKDAQSTGRMSSAKLGSYMSMIDVTVKLAQVHATLATVKDVDPLFGRMVP